MEKTHRADFGICAIYMCGAYAEHGGHVLLEEHLSREYYFILPLCVSHNKRAEMDVKFFQTKGRVRPVPIKWHPEVPMEGDTSPSRTSLKGGGRAGGGVTRAPVPIKGGGKCRAVTQKGMQCKRAGDPDFCKQHKTSPDTPCPSLVPPVNGRCRALTKGGTQCKRAGDPTFCWQHK